MPNKGQADAQTSSKSSASSSSNVIIGVVGTLVVVVVGVFIYKRSQDRVEGQEDLEEKQQTWVKNPSTENTYDAIGTNLEGHTYTYDETPGEEDLYAQNPWDREGPVSDSPTYDLAGESNTTYLEPTPLRDQGLEPIEEEEEGGPEYDQAINEQGERKISYTNEVYDGREDNAILGSESEEEDKTTAVYSVVKKENTDDAKFDI